MMCTSSGETVSEKYSFSSNHLCKHQETYEGDTLKQYVGTLYDAYELPERIVTKKYGTTTMTVTELYTHDKYGNTLTYISPKGGGSTSNTEYRTSYTYDPSYQLMLSEEYRQDRKTVIRKVNRLTEDGKNIAETCVYANGDLQSKTEYTYDSAGRVLTKTEYPSVNVTNAAGITTRYTYSGANLASETVTGMKDAEGYACADLTQSYTYDEMGRVLSAADRNGGVTETAYDERGRAVMVTNPDGSRTTYAYDAGANRTEATESGRETVVYDYDGLGRIQAVYYASGDLQKEYYYDEQGRVRAEATGQGSSASGTVYYQYDLYDRETEKTVYDRDGRLVYRETTEYDDAYTWQLSRVKKTVWGDANAESVVTVTDINESGEIVREETGGVANEYEYDYVGNRVYSYYTVPAEDEIPEDDIVPEDETVFIGSYTYDYRGNVLSEKNAAGYVRTIVYDGLGRKIRESDYLGNETVYAYDNAGRLLWQYTPMTDTEDAVTRYFYDGNGNIVEKKWTAQADTESMPDMRRIQYTYDCMNRVTDVAQEISAMKTEYTHYSYNEAGDLTDMYTGMTAKWTALMDPSSYSHTRYTYDGRGNNTSLTDPLGQSESYIYDPLGYAASVKRRDGTIVLHVYNVFGKVVVEKIYPDITEAEPEFWETDTRYTSTGAVQSVKADGDTVTYTYDGLGNMLSETEGETVKTYTYDDRGRKSGYTLYVDGEEKSSAVYEYDVLNRLISVTEGGKTTTYTYDANGNRASQTIGAVTTAYTYNKANLVTSITNTMENAAGEDTEISRFGYTYYMDGNIRTKTETLLGSTKTTAYTYDGAGRLWSETAEDGTISYTYDARGNRTHMNNAGTVTAYTYDANNRLLSETTGGETTAYTYDANGNTLTAGNRTYTYNARGQQTGYTDGTVTASYAYNPSGLRSSKTVGGSTKYFIYNGMNIVYEYDDSGETLYYYGLNRTHNSDGEIYVYNAHGDVVQLVKDNAVTVSYTYDAFGNITEQIGTNDNPFLYCGEYYDAETETYYLRARYYNPANGRFSAEDTHWNLSNMLYGDSPVKMNEYEDALGLNKYTLLPNTEAIGQSGNLYVYCANNPVVYIDPNGKFVISATTLLVAGGIALVGTIGGLVGNHIAEEKGATGWEKAGYIAGGAVLGGAIGGVGGYFAAPAIISATGVAGISVSSAGISTVAAAGTTFGSMGTLLAQSPNIAVDWSKYAEHALQRMLERGITQSMVDTWVATGKVLQQGMDKFVYITKEGVAVVNGAGKLITAYSSANFDSTMQEIVRKLFGG